MKQTYFNRISTGICCLFLLGFLPACDSTTSDKAGKDGAGNEHFDTYKNNLITDQWKLHPEWATSIGYHKYDSALTINTPERRENLLQTYRNNLKQLNETDFEKLSVNNQTDYLMLKNYLESQIWELEKFKSHEWNPAAYNLGSSVAEILNGRHASLETRLRNISEKIKRSEAYYVAARQSLNNPTREHTELAILQNRGALSVFGSAMVDSVQRSNLKPAEKDLLLQRIETARQAIQNYIHFLEQDQLPALKKGQGRSFRIGKELYEQKFRYDIQSKYTATEVYEMALKRKAETLRKMADLSRRLWPGYFPGKPMPDSLLMIKMVIGKIAEKHVQPDSFMVAIKRQIPELVAFVNTKKLLTQDPSKPLIVRETPEYMRGIAGASINAPGPYDKTADTYYNVTPLDGYTQEQAESYLREYNNYTLQILNIHEAIPGHYTQLVYSNMSPSIVKSVLGNGAMVEGWAVYTELMMLEAGYGNQNPELLLMYYKWHLRTILNTILDYKVHVLGLPEQQAVKMLMTEGFQEEAEARGKWRRATLSQVQLTSYFTGFMEIYDLRETLKKKLGKKFDLKNFHEQFLSYGSAPVKYISNMMLNSRE